ncbi:MAG TPA: LacI family DNA-binding transcriptional regulator, partial [Rariglobus sp.]
TVSMALRNDPVISGKQTERIQKIATKMGYRTNALVARLMHELRSSKKRKHVATLAFVNASLESGRSHNPPSSIVQGWESGAESRAAKLGYNLNHFWLHEPGLTPSRLAGIFHARNVQGVVFHSLGETAKARMSECEPIWSRFPLVTIGARLESPALNYVSNDQYSTALHACRRLLELGYKRIGLYMSSQVDNAADKRFVMGYRAGLEQAEIKAPPVLYINRTNWDPQPHLKEDSGAFAAWLKKHRIEACLAVNGHILDWTARLGMHLPDDLGIALLYLPKALQGKVAGMEHRLEWTGMAAIDTVVGQILRNEFGIPSFQQGTLTESVWIDGPTVKPNAGRLERVCVVTA